MRQSSLVILTPIRPGMEQDLRACLADRIEPIWDDAEGIQCFEGKMRFDRLNMLHFACFAVIEEDEPGRREDPIQSCLLFEATVDGDTGEFLEELIEICGDELDLIYRHCKGYPASGVNQPLTVKRYLAGHNVRPQIYFQGHPGRTLAEIRGESQLRGRLVARLEHFRTGDGTLTETRHDIQRDLRRFATQSPKRDEAGPDGETGPPKGDQVDLRWTTERRADPFETRWGRRLTIASAVFLSLLVAIAGIRLSDFDIAAFATCMRDVSGLFAGCATAFNSSWLSAGLATLVAWPFVWGGWVLSWVWTASEFEWLAVANILGWLLARLAVFALAAQPKPPNAGIGWMLLQSLKLAAILLRIAVQFVLFGLAFSALPVQEKPSWLPDSALGIALTLAFALIIGGAALLTLRFIKTLPALDSSYGHDTAFMRAGIALVSDILWLAMAGVVWLLLLVAQWLFDFLSVAPESDYATVVGWIVAGALTVVVVLGVILVVGVAWLVSIYFREKYGDNVDYKSAEILPKYERVTGRFAREGHGVNKVQNHLISVSRIKPGRLRLLRLRLVLFVVNQMCRWWFTRGELGDVREIHFLRWLIINEGRHLLFLDTYHGSWSGYLDAFIDSGSVHGLNAIWSHTYQFIPEEEQPIGFPRTECMFWKGARDERPFKEAVRASQVETIVWYSAYPTIGGVNIITNSKIRNRLFETLTTAELDALFNSIN